MNMALHDRIRERAYFLSLSSGGAGDGTHFWLMAEREVLTEVAMESTVAFPLTEAIESVETKNQTAVLNAIEMARQPAAEQQKNTADEPLAAANGSALEAKARLIADITRATNCVYPLRLATAAPKRVATLLPKLTLDELRDRISEDRITQCEVMAALSEPLAKTDDGQLRSKLKQAITSANIYYSSRRWGHARTLERAKARLIADIAKVAA
jgi:hypothetical protein